jgi:hypothetical protein
MPFSFQSRHQPLLHIPLFILHKAELANLVLPSNLPGILRPRSSMDRTRVSIHPLKQMEECPFYKGLDNLGQPETQLDILTFILTFRSHGLALEASQFLFLDRLFYR